MSIKETVDNVAQMVTGELVKKGMEHLFAFFPGLQLKRLKHFTEVCEQASEYLRQRNIPLDECRQISDKQGLVFIPGASVEDEPELQDCWARYLANALDPSFDEAKLRTTFMGMLQEMTSADVRLLRDFGKVLKLDIDLYRREHGLDEAAFGVSLSNLNRLGCVMQVCDGLPVQAIDPRVGKKDVSIPIPTQFYARTFLGTAFLEACCS